METSGFAWPHTSLFMYFRPKYIYVYIRNYIQSDVHAKFLIILGGRLPLEWGLEWLCVCALYMVGGKEIIGFRLDPFDYTKLPPNGDSNEPGRVLSVQYYRGLVVWYRVPNPDGLSTLYSIRVGYTCWTSCPAGLTSPPLHLLVMYSVSMHRHKRPSLNMTWIWIFPQSVVTVLDYRLSTNVDNTQGY